MHRLIAVVAVVAMALGLTVPAQAEKPHTCGTGEVNAVFQALPVGFNIVNDQGRSLKTAGLGGGFDACTLPLFRDGDTYTFREGEPFISHVTYVYDYVRLGVSRDEAITEISELVDTVTLNKVGDPPVEQSLMTTAFKNFNHPEFGLTVYQTRAFITELEVGTYESRFSVDNGTGIPTGEAVVTIEIIP